MIKIVLDTNVLISGIFFSGPPGKILEAWRSRKIDLVISPEILEEYLNVAKRLSVCYSGLEYEEILALIMDHAQMVQSVKLTEGVCENPDDDKFLSCALTAKATIIVSGDRDLLDVSGYRDLQVLTPAVFASRYL